MVKITRVAREVEEYKAGINRLKKRHNMTRQTEYKVKFVPKVVDSIEVNLITVCHLGASKLPISCTKRYTGCRGCSWENSFMKAQTKCPDLPLVFSGPYNILMHHGLIH